MDDIIKSMGDIDEYTDEISKLLIELGERMEKQNPFNMGLRARHRRVFITPNEEYYREKNLEYGWRIIGEAIGEITWSAEE
jgi:hypothetical protein